MLLHINRLKLIKKFVNLVVALTFVSACHLTIFAETASAESKVFYHGKPEDPRLKKLIKELKTLLPTMFKMLFSLEWLKDPRNFYRTLKRLIVVWYKTIVELVAVLMGYIFQIDKEISTSSCEDQACTGTG